MINPPTMDGQTARAQGKSQAGLIKFLLVVFIIGFHTRLSIYSGATIIVPMYLCLLSGAFILWIALQRGMQRLLPPLLSLFGLITVTSLCAGLFGGDAIALLRGAIQLSVSIVIATGIAVVLSGQETRDDDVFFLRIWAVFLAIACVELIPTVRPIFDQVSSVLYGGTGRGMYAALDRDLALYGQYRPKAFASEPSFLAATLSTLNLLVLVTGVRRRGRRYAVARFLGMVLAAYFVAPSLSMFFYIAAGMVFVFWPKTVGGKVAAGLTLLVSVAVLASLPSASGGTFSAHQKSGSFFGRITAGPYVGVQSLMERPLFGYGVGDAEAAYPAISNVWSEHGAYSAFPWYTGLRAIDLMSNGFWWQWIYFGIFGGALLVVNLIMLLKAMGILRPLAVLFAVWIVWYAGATFVDVISWWVFGIFASAGIVGASSRHVAHRGI